MPILITALLTGLATVIEKAVNYLLPEAFVKAQVLRGLKYLAKRTGNKVDDEIVSELEVAIYPERAKKLPKVKKRPICRNKACKCVCHK